MIKLNEELQHHTLHELARQLCVAARTAPKARGLDFLTTAIVFGAEKDRLAATMREIARRDGVAFFERDAGNLDVSPVVVLLGSRREPIGLPHCGYCGFSDCRELMNSGGICAFNSGDLGIALGSAVSRAADLRLDNRILYSAGKAALELKMLGPNVVLAYGLPLSVSSKSPFFDRK